MTGRQRLAVAGLVLAAVLTGVLLVAFASRACPVQTPLQRCPAAALNVVLVIIGASLAVALLVTPFAFLADFLTRGRIVYRGTWFRAARRGVLAGLLVALLASLRLGGALTVPVLLFLLVMAVLTERFLTARGA